MMTLRTAFSALAVAAFAEEKPKPQTPAVLPGGKIVAAAEAKALYDGKKTLFFDMRSAVNFGKGHIPVAKALPYKENSEFSADFDVKVDQFDLSQLPTDKSAAMVFYSDGPTGWKSSSLRDDNRPPSATRRSAPPAARSSTSWTMMLVRIGTTCASPASFAKAGIRPPAIPRSISAPPSIA